MKVSDAIALWLRDRGVHHVYVVSGGANLHIIDSLSRLHGIQYVCTQTEQGASFAADATARLTGSGCCLATSGPGATNLITGIAASYYDSVPTLYLTGNQTRERLKPYGRQYGFQATPICDMVRPIVKYAITVMDEGDVIRSLNHAWAVAHEQRRGPVLVDIPDDIQRCMNS